MLLVPEDRWEQMLDELARHDPSVERIAYLDGVRLTSLAGLDLDNGIGLLTATDAVVTTVTFPDAELHPGWFRVSADAMRDAGHHLRRDHLARLAQIHTHGLRGVDHSPTDDQDAYSQRVGSVSIVLPEHARNQQRLEGAGVHVRDRNGWRRLSASDSTGIIRFVPSLIDLREQTCLNSLIATPETPVVASWLSTTPRRRWWRSLFPRK